jgi:hypothetical protein
MRLNLLNTQCDRYVAYCHELLFIFCWFSATAKFVALWPSIGYVMLFKSFIFAPPLVRPCYTFLTAKIMSQNRDFLFFSHNFYDFWSKKCLALALKILQKYCLLMKYRYDVTRNKTPPPSSLSYILPHRRSPSPPLKRDVHYGRPRLKYLLVTYACCYWLMLVLALDEWRL